MDNYIDISPDKAYQLIGHGPVVLVSTKSEGSEPEYDVTPIAWHCPVHKSPTRVLIVVGKRHKTHENLISRNEFILNIPNKSAAGLVRKTGSVSAREVDKFKEFNIDSKPGKEIDAKIVSGCIGWLECKVIEKMQTGEVGLIIGECVYAAVDKSAYNERLIVEKPSGKTIHHLGNRIFCIPSDELDIS